MKKFLLTLVAVVMCVTAMAQTNFRKIDFTQAIEAAKKENKQVFIDFYTTWCGPCRRMASEVFPVDKVGKYMNSKFVCVKYDADREGKELAQRFGVNAFPTFVILNADEQVSFELKGFMDPDAFLSKMESSANPDWSVENMAKRYDGGERTPLLINRYALHVLQQGDEAKGFQIVNDYFNSLTDKQRLDDENSFLFTRYTVQWDDAKAKFMIANRNKFPSKIKTKINERIEALYHQLVVSYFSGYMWKEGQFDATKFAEVKENVKHVSADKRPGYEAMFRLTESRIADDDMAFWAKCKAEYTNLALSDRDLLIMNISRLISSEETPLLSDITIFIRENLKDMRSTTIMLAGRVLNSLESKIAETKKI